MPDPGGYRGKRTPAKSSSAARGLGYEHRPTANLCSAATSTGRFTMALRSRCHCGPGCICRKAGYALPCTATRTSTPTACRSRQTTRSVAVKVA